jgi:hypothetical protein
MGFLISLYGKKVKYKTYQECVMKISQFQAGKLQSIHAYNYQYFLPEPIDHGTASATVSEFKPPAKITGRSSATFAKRQSNASPVPP